MVIWWSKSLQIIQNANLTKQIFIRSVLNDALVYLLFILAPCSLEEFCTHSWNRWRAGEICVKRIAKSPGFPTSARTARAEPITLDISYLPMLLKIQVFPISLLALGQNRFFAESGSSPKTCFCWGLRQREGRSRLLTEFWRSRDDGCKRSVETGFGLYLL